MHHLIVGLPIIVDSPSDGGSTDDNADSPPSDFFPPNVDSSSSDGSTDDNADLSATPTENNPTLPSETPLSNNTENVQGRGSGQQRSGHAQPRACCRWCSAA